MTSEETTDYLIVGSGATGMAFADTLLSESDATITIVDREHQPGGHWLHAYPFVTLHQPSQFYGLASLELSNGRIDSDGLNAGMHSLATGAEITAYYQRAMASFLATGRVRYLPMSHYHGDFTSGANSVTSLLSGQDQSIQVERAVVDATFLRPAIPATHTPAFSIGPGVQLVPINALTHQAVAAPAYVILGGGKTGMDACLWLLKNGVDPDAITWIMPRDGWMLDRANTQPGLDFFERSIGALASQFESIAQADSIDDMFDRLEYNGYFLRLDPAVRPTMFHGATVSQAELKELQRIKQVIRLGRVKAIHKDCLEMERGSIPSGPQQLFVDCTASAIRHTNTKPIFETGLITPQLVRSYQPTFSASLVAYVEAHYRAPNPADSDALASALKKQNQLCTVVPIPNHDTDYIRFTAAAMTNQYTWSQDKPLRNWIASNRLDGFSRMMASIDKDDLDRQSILGKLRENSMPAAMKLQQFLAQIRLAGD